MEAHPDVPTQLWRQAGLSIAGGGSGKLTFALTTAQFLNNTRIINRLYDRFARLIEPDDDPACLGRPLHIRTYHEHVHRPMISAPSAARPGRLGVPWFLAPGREPSARGPLPGVPVGQRSRPRSGRSGDPRSLVSPAPADPTTNHHANDWREGPAGRSRPDHGKHARAHRGPDLGHAPARTAAGSADAAWGFPPGDVRATQRFGRPGPDAARLTHWLCAAA